MDRQAAARRGDHPLVGQPAFTWDPLPLTLAKSADDAVKAGLLKLGQNKLAGIYDLRLLN